MKKIIKYSVMCIATVMALNSAMSYGNTIEQEGVVLIKFAEENLQSSPTKNKETEEIIYISATELKELAVKLAQQKKLTLTKINETLKIIEHIIKIGGSIAIIIGTGYVLVKTCGICSALYEKIKEVGSALVWLFSIPGKIVPEDIKQLYIEHNKENPFM